MAYTRGTLVHCVRTMLDHWKHSPEELASIVHFERAKYYVFITPDEVSRLNDPSPIDTKRPVLSMTREQFFQMAHFLRDQYQLEL